ncbi:zinc finger protein datilografo [Glossina fuscipes fuscipes]
MTTTDLEQGHVTHSHVQQRSQQHTYNTFNNQQQHHQLQTQTHLINPFKMDADFWQQARSGSFGLHAAAALASNHIGHHHSHHQAQQTSVGNVAAQLHHPQQLHQQQQHLSGQVASADQQMHQLTSPPVISASQQHHQPHLSQLCTEQNHHLLFNAAAAAAAAAHLSGVVSKSHELDSTNITQDEDNNDILSGNKSRNGNNNECSSAATKQELSAIPGCSNNLLPTANNGTHTDNNIHHEQSLQLQTVQQQQQPLKYEHEACTSNNLPLEALQQQLQQQVQHQEQQISADKAERDSGIQSDKHIANSLHASHHHNMQQEHHQRHSQQTQLTVNAVGRSGDTSHNESPTHLQQLRMQSLERRSSPDTQPPTLPLHSEDPLQINTFAKNGPTTTSPQPSLNSASGGSSTPDLKFNSENNKVPGELQLQLSRSNSAAAISERTLEECWSTLQRLFMHKSAMQQIQQQIPRVGLGGTATNNLVGNESKPHQCQQCMKSFSSNHQLVQHIRVHTGEKPYKCSYCDRRFKQLSHVQQHTRLHTGERPYKCHLPDCGRAFIQLSNLQQHLRNHDAQVERAKNRPFHCNICGKGFATESSLRTHTSKELQLHLGVLQQHAALIGGPNATSCPICHKLFLGTDALMEHMKHVHKEKPNQNTNSSFIDNIGSGVVTCVSNGVNVGTCAGSAAADTGVCLQSSGPSSVCSDPYSTKRRTANNPCPVCGKHYVNEGSLRKHLACHAETSQLTNSLRMWPCSVCQAVFTHENGLLTHMEHMRMDPKHQFAAQYVLSRAAAERRERGSLLAVTLAASAGTGAAGTSGFMPLLSGEIGSHRVINVGGDGDGGGDISNSLCPSPSAHSDCSSNGRPSSSTTSDQCSGINLLTNNNDNSMNNNNHNNNNINNNNNDNCNTNGSNLNLGDKLSDILRTTNNSNSHAPAQHHPHHSSQPHHHTHNLNNHSYNNVSVSIEGELHDVANRMSLMAAASAAAAAVAASTSTNALPRVPSSPQDFSVETVNTAQVNGNVAVQAAVVNLATAMRINHVNNNGVNSGATNMNNNNMLVNHSNRNQQQQPQQQQSLQQQQHQQTTEQTPSERRTSPLHNLVTDNAPIATSMIRNSMLDNSAELRNNNHPHQQRQEENHDQQKQTHNRANYSSSILPAPLPAALGNTNTHQSHHHFAHQTLNTPNHHLQHHLESTHTPQTTTQHSPQTSIHMQQQAEAMLRSHTEVAFRLAAGVAVSSSNNQNSGPIGNNNNNCSTNLGQLSNNNNNDDDMNGKVETSPRILTSTNASAATGCSDISASNRDPTLQAPKIESIAPASDINGTVRLQEHRIEQALRLRSDARTFNFLSGNRQQTAAINSNTSKPQQQN